MSLEPLAGRVYGPLSLRLSQTKVGEFVHATGDDPGRWVETAPPSYAGALLFSVAPVFIGDPDVGEHTRVLVHTDQLFRWHGPLHLGVDVEVTGTVARVRVRGGLNFVTFDVSVATAGGDPLLDSTSTFLMGATPAAEPNPDVGEPPVTAGSTVDRPPQSPQIAAGAALAPFVRSASRLDLVRYAAASGDFNPIHFDHEAAREAGLDGIVVHGLLMTSWLCQAAATVSSVGAPLAEMKLRFRNALRPAAAAEVTGTVESATNQICDMSQRISSEGADLVTAKTVVRLA